MIDAKRIGDCGLARSGKRIEFARRESAKLAVCRGIVVGRAPAFGGRPGECATLDGMVSRVREGEKSEPGMPLDDSWAARTLGS